jgi:SlyX protein
MDENRLINIETKLAHQEHLVDELNLALTDQQSRITELEALCRRLVERLQSLAESAAGEAGDEERPPHY